MIKKIMIIFMALFLTGFECNEFRDIELDTLKGTNTKVSDFKGKIVVVAWWATWCKPCLQELKFLSKVVKKYPEDLVVVAISTDGPETRASVNTTIRSKRLDNLVVLIDPEGTTNLQGQMPYSVYLDRKGLLCSDHLGFVSGDEEHILTKIKKLLKKK